MQRLLPRLGALFALVGLADAGQLGARAHARLRSGSVGHSLAIDEHAKIVATEALSKEAPTVPPIPAPWNPAPKRCATGYMHIGCVKDTQTQMRRWYHKHVEKEDREPMTVEVCWNFCRNVSGAQFFGMENGNRCYCTPTFHSGMEVREEDVCDMPCEGDETVMCGGNKGQQDMYEMHDCQNLPSMPCSKPPVAFPNAKLFKSSYYFGAMVPCSNTRREGLETGKNMRCEVECEKGYYVADNTLKCVEMGQRMTYSWAQVTGSASCEPVQCGMPPQIRFAKFARTLVEYPKNVTYACDLGYTTDGTAQGPKQQDVKCLAEAKFDTIEECKPVRCGACPTGKKYPNAAPREPENRTYREECTYDCEEGYTLNQQADGIKLFTITCLHTGEFAEPPTCSPVSCGVAPVLTNAHQVEAKSKGTEEVYPNKVAYKCDHGYSLDRMPGGKAAFELSCLADGTFSTAPVCKAVKVGNPPIVRHSIYDDRMYYYGESVTYTCVTGYTMDGKADGNNMHTLFTAPTGQWKGQAPKCLPVECGALPMVAHADAVSPPSGPINYATAPVAFSCSAGYSTSVSDDIWNPTKADFFVSCKADGTFATKDCVNIDDCLIRNCGEHGTCVDLPSPTNLPLDNYDCKCESGYEITLHNSTLMEGAKRKVCTNINDCPVKDACGGKNAKGLDRGLCTDLVNGYDCTCGAGYQVATVGGNQTCEPISCGKVPPAANATYTPAVTGTKVDYDTPKWLVECDKGYSYDGQAGGPKSTEIICRSTGTLKPSPTCVRVSCGAPKFVGNADMAPALSELLYKDSVTYTCDEGHALKGDAKGLRSWEIVCLGSGTLSEPDTEPGGEPVRLIPETEKPNITTEGGRPKATLTATTTPLACLPVLCGTLPPQEHASWNATREYVYGQSARVECDEGYSVDGSTSDASGGYDVPCASDGTFTVTQRCRRVVCADPPSFDNTKYSPAKGPYKYGDRVEYSMEPGYELQLPNGSKINTTFECYCASNGEFNDTCALDVTVATINCGPAPEVKHATVTGSTNFGGTLTAKADTGYTIDGSPKGETEFTFHCKASGRFSARQSFQRIECGLCPEIDHVEEVEFIDAEAALVQLGQLMRNSSLSGLKTRAKLATLQEEARKAARRSGKRLFSTKYGDEVKYLCKEGYRAASGAGALPLPVDTVTPKDPGAFELKCDLDGDHTPTIPRPDDPKCMPVTCDIKRGKPTDKAHPLFKGDSDIWRLTYKETMDYMCRPGLSLDGTPTGDIEFTEECLSTGDVSKTNLCKDIDWCLVSKCGEHGKCVDGEFAYGCDCDPGYEVAFEDSMFQTCENIDECATMGGYSSCSVGGGKCVDGLLGYTCECTTGHENVPTMSGRDSCSPVMCSVLPVKDNAISELQGQKMSYGESTAYMCQEGYSLTGKVGGDMSFQVDCKADKTNGNIEKECKPVECEKAADLEHAKVVGPSTVVYGESLVYTCDKGTTTNGQPVGASNFSVPCLSSGKLGTYETCELITCGAPPVAALAVSGTLKDAVLYDETVPYTCQKGYSLDGKAAGAKSFDAKCEADGSFSGMQSCKAITCGKLDKGDMKRAQYSFGEYRYPSIVPVVCDTGSTVDADPDGESTFFVQCGADGQYENKKDCELVKCPVPKAPKSESPDKTGTVNYDETVVYTCSAGYSTDGTAGGSRSFDKKCEASGSLSRSSPGACVDIDYCLGSPCGANGVCTDAGVGVPAPGYKCTCFEGFEVRKNARGGEVCAADDCAGEPCGEGGSCTDLSKEGGPQGAYSCACDPGYELVEPEPMKYTCRRRECGELPAIENTVEKDGKPYGVFDEWGTPMETLTLQSFDRATVKCRWGHSTDQRWSPETRTFTVACGANGKFVRKVEPEKECLPVICENPFLPSITHASLANPGVITYGKFARYACSPGYTTNGELSGKSEFRIKCQHNGTFAEDTTQCLPIPCDVKERKHATASRSSLRFGEQVMYTCDIGYEIPHPTTPRISYEGTCMEDGTVEAEDVECKPVECGPIPAQPEATPVPPAVNGTAKFGDAVRYVCAEGFTLGGIPGGDASYQIACQAFGLLTGMVDSLPGGPPAGSGICKKAGYSVEGRVTDAQDGNLYLENAKVTFTENSTGAEVAVVYTDRAGIYSANIPPGAVMMKAELEGYIAREEGPIVVAGPLKPGQGTSIALSKELPPNDWRIILNWNEDPADLDSWTEFGCGLGQKVGWTQTSGASESAGGLTVDLDRDATQGRGPETTTITGAGKCTKPGCCLIKFKVHHFSGRKTLGTSGATVSVYKGSSRVAKYPIPECVGDKLWWTVFTIDAWNATNVNYEGDKSQPPYLDEDTVGTSNWAVSFDTMRWSTARSSTGNLAAITSLNMQSLTRLHRLDGARYMEIRDGLESSPMCKDFDIHDILPTEEWFLCPEGYFLNGLYRTGTKFDDTSGMEQLAKARCCTANVAVADLRWGKCHNEELAADVGWKGCGLSPETGYPTAMVGLHAKFVEDPTVARAYDGPKAKHAVTSKGIYLGGEYIQLGIRRDSQVGKMGTSEMPPSGFVARSSGRRGIGMTADREGFSKDPSGKYVVDYFLPGFPAEGFYVGYRHGGRVSECNNCGQDTEDTTPENSPTASARVSFTFNGKLKVVTNISLGVNDKFFKTEVELTNVAKHALQDVRYVRSVDADNTVDQSGAYPTTMTLEGTIAADGYAAVSAKSQPNDRYYSVTGGRQATLLYFSKDSRAKASYDRSGYLQPSGTYDSKLYDSCPRRGQKTTIDAWMSMAFDFGTLPPGQSVKAEFFTALDDASLKDIIESVKVASEPFLALNEVKCCSVANQEPAEGSSQCGA